jgi:acetylornithine deacetylase/succinyl-diaminopimelate desuccinylase-like protein
VHPPQTLPAPVALATDPVELARAMIRLDTSHLGGGGATVPHALLLAELCGAAGLATEVIPTPVPDNAHLVARLTGRGTARPLLFLGHSDVVTATGEEWTVDPFAGAVRNGWLYGRGALDMKGANAAFLSALLRHVDEGAVFDRDIVFVSDCDEEGGAYGTDWLVENHFAKVDAGVVLTEGGWTLTDPPVAALTCAERRSVVVELSAQGPATHTSKPYPDQVIVRLGRALGRLGDDFHRPVLPSALSREYFAAVGAATGDPGLASAVRDLLSASTQDGRDDAGARIVRHSRYPWLHNALLRTTVSFVETSGGYYSSVVPGRARALARIAFLPGGEDPHRVLTELAAFVAPDGVCARVVPEPGLTGEETVDQLVDLLAIPPSTTDTDVFAMWQAAVRETFPGVTPVAGQFEARSSAAPFQRLGIPVYGVYPYPVDNDTLTRMHGADERVGVAALRQGAELFYRLLAGMRVSP